MQTNWILYGTEGCHLCEEAFELFKQSAPDKLGRLEKVDIAYDNSLFEQYKFSIPVLKDSQGRELYWPFDAQSLNEFLS
ncbi:glutaredoxin family protein [Bowmanella dokdonensis]|uniref:Glutaredoxin family protein n=1 Tax=Bowmanella dokdonensis TaxID=751969 RepID=A0A939IN15_9ALTE|nr:glutaredoxin family protein [Bowmanella dokdonensis]MBN7824370.1 glutaredoxin family protein [Bowmanella dokdonensis]